MPSAPDPDRAALLTATTAVVAERGYADTTLAAILDRAGVGELAFRRQFADTEDAFCVAIEQATDDLLGRAAPAFGGQPRWSEALRAVAYELRDFLLEDRARARAMVVESFTACERSRQVRERGMAALAALIGLGRAQLDDPGAVPAKTAELTAGAIYNRIHAAVESGAELEDAMVRALMYTAVRPYLGLEAALAELEAPRPTP
jgi:AcrR family transcriptional regulator